MARDAVIVDAVRTPVGKRGGGLSHVHPADLGAVVDLMQAGKIRQFGVGLERLDNATSWLQLQPLSSMQLPFGVLDPDPGSADVRRTVTVDRDQRRNGR